MANEGYILITNNGKDIDDGAWFPNNMHPSAGGLRVLDVAHRGMMALYKYLSYTNSDYADHKKAEHIFLPDDHTLSEFIHEMDGGLVKVEYTYLFDYSGVQPMLKVFHWGKPRYEIPADAFGRARIVFDNEETLLSILSADEQHVASKDGVLHLRPMLRGLVSEDFIHGILMDARGCCIEQEYHRTKTLSGVNEFTRWPVTVWGPQFTQEVELKSELAGLYQKTSVLAKRLSNGKYVGSICFDEQVLNVFLQGPEKGRFPSEHAVYEAGRKLLEKNPEKVVWFTVFTELCKWVRIEAQSLPAEPTKERWARAARLCRKTREFVVQVAAEHGTGFDGDEQRFLEILDNYADMIRAREKHIAK